MEIRLEPNLSDETLLKLHESYKQDKEDKLIMLKAKSPQLFKDAKNYLYVNRKDIFHDVKNAQLRKTNSLES